jgi:hypothetical protein
MHLIELQRRLMRHDIADRVEGRIHRAIAGRLAGVMLAIHIHGQDRLSAARRFRR